MGMSPVTNFAGGFSVGYFYKRAAASAFLADQPQDASCRLPNVGKSTMKPIPHSPGPWCLAGQSVIRWGTKKLGGTVAMVHFLNREPNARLLIAAPTLLDDLAELIGAIDAIDAAGDDDALLARYNRALNAARATVVKAKGEG